jgi:hypothetical protein
MSLWTLVTRHYPDLTPETVRTDTLYREALTSLEYCIEVVRVMISVVKQNPSHKRFVYRALPCAISSTDSVQATPRLETLWGEAASDDRDMVEHFFAGVRGLTARCALLEAERYTLYFMRACHALNIQDLYDGEAYKTADPDRRNDLSELASLSEKISATYSSAARKILKTGRDETTSSFGLFKSAQWHVLSAVIQATLDFSRCSEPGNKRPLDYGKQALKRLEGALETLDAITQGADTTQPPYTDSALHCLAQLQRFVAQCHMPVMNLVTRVYFARTDGVVLWKLESELSVHTAEKHFKPALATVTVGASIRPAIQCLSVLRDAAFGNMATAAAVMDQQTEVQRAVLLERHRWLLFLSRNVMRNQVVLPPEWTVRITQEIVVTQDMLARHPYIPGSDTSPLLLEHSQ